MLEKNKKIHWLLIAALALLTVSLGEFRLAGAGSTSNSTNVISGSNCSDGSSNCGTYYAVQTNLNCFWINGANSCSDNQYNPKPDTGSLSTYITDVNYSVTPGTCSANGNSESFTGNIFGITVPYWGGSGSAPYTGNNDSSVTGSMVCFSGGVSAVGAYRITACNAGYTATGDNYCTKNATCVINSFTCDGSATLAWSTSNCSNRSISPTIGSVVATGNTQGIVGTTYTLTADGLTSTAYCPAPALNVTGGGSQTVTPGTTVTLPSFNFSNTGESGSIIHYTGCYANNPPPTGGIIANEPDCPPPKDLIAP